MVILKDMIAMIEDLDVVKSWLKDLSSNSRSSYLGALAEFCIANDIEPIEMLETIHKEEEDRLPQWERTINKWFENFDEYCKKQNRSINTRNLRRTVVNGFIGFHGLTQYTENGRRRKPKQFKEPNKRKGLNEKDIQDLLGACKSLKMKAIILTQISSGLSTADIIKLKIKDFQKGIVEAYDIENRMIRRICKLKLVRQKTNKEFTTFLSEEAVNAIERYLKLERINPKPEQALFSSYKKTSRHMANVTINFNYQSLNRYLGWEQSEKREFRKATSHMMRKYFNTQMINAGMPEEIREHFMAHQINDKVKDAYFLENPEELQEVYLKYMDKVTIGPVKAPVTLPEFTMIKRVNEDMQKELNELKGTIANHELAIEEPNQELMEENKRLGAVVNDLVSCNDMQENKIAYLTDLVESMQKELSKFKAQS